MEITGTNTYNYEIYPQSGMSANFYTQQMGDFRFRVLTNSGGNYYQDIIFQSGKVFAGRSQTSGDYNIVGSYKKQSPFEFEFRYNTGRFALYLDKKVKMDGFQILLTGTQPSAARPTITGFTFSGLESGYKLTGNMSIYGHKPGVFFSQLYPYNTGTQTGLYSGWMIISGLPGKLNYLYSPELTQTTIPSSAFTSGNYIVSGLNFYNNSSINTDFNFNFGTVNTDLIVYQVPSGVGQGYLNVSLSSAQAVYSGLPSPVQYQDYIVTNLVPGTGNFQPYLEFLYRSGDMTISGTGTMTGMMTGYIYGSGYLYGSGTGTTTTGYYSQRGVTYGLPSFYSGYSGEMTRRFSYGTGQVIYQYSVLSTGVEGYYIGEAPSPTTGYLTGYLTGVINDGSGYYHFNQYISGRPRFWSGQYQTGNQATGGYYNNVNSPESHYYNTFSGLNYTGLLDVIVYFSGNMSRQYTQPFTGVYRSGFYSTASGYLTGFDLKTGDVSVLTGTYQYVNSNYYSYTGNGYKSGRFLIKPSTPVSDNLYEYGMRVTYDRNIPQEMKDYYRFVATDGTNTSYTTGIGFYL